MRCQTPALIQTSHQMSHHVLDELSNGFSTRIFKQILYPRVPVCLVDCLNFGLALNETPLTAREEEEEIELQKKELALLALVVEIFEIFLLGNKQQIEDPGRGT